MPAQRSADPMTDDDLDRELAAAFAVEPSAEFLARVRMRIDGEPAPSAWGLWRAFAVAGACAVMIAFALTAAQLNRAAPRNGSDRVPPSRAFADLSFILPTIVAAPLAGVPLAMAAATPRRVQKPTPAMQAIMQANAEAGRALRVHRKEGNYEAIARDAATYKENFAYIAVFWANQQVDAALNISTRGLRAAIELEAAALAKDDAAVEKAMTALTDTCDTCHKTHREQLPDKTYAIRL
jgi:hypothetical protein